FQSPPSQPKPIEYKETTLPNGLRIITHEDHSTPVINVQVWYHVGSKDEKPGRTGFAHLFEHLMIKGSAHIKPEEHAKHITNAGQVHPYKHVTIGSMQDLDAATIEDVREFYHTYYIPNNATIAISGDLKTDEAVDWLKKYFGNIPSSPQPRVRQNAKEPPQE